MDDNLIKRINELYKKQKSEGLTESEKKEQGLLRKEYIKLFRENFRQTMDSIRIKNEDGTIQPLKKNKNN
ncbi:MAG: DUF896 domain-containing protein [Epulopiscium sp.]|nr:DUF896 domain-containing protein [Candidatus Epulonipiscium sp.]